MCALSAPFVLSVAGTAAAQAPTEPLRVTIEAPTAGIVSGQVVQFEASVSDPEADSAVLVSNGATYHVPIEQGRIHQTLIAVPGNNRVAVVVRHNGRTARASLTFSYDGEPVEMAILLTWPSLGEIVDLWVREPSGETCKWDHRSTEAGGRLLDFSADAIGFGSQAYVLSHAVAGTYRVKVHYWGAWGRDDQRAFYEYDDLLNQMGVLQDERSSATRTRQQVIDQQVGEVELALDEWSRPAAPQTPVRAEVILFPGDPLERRWSFDVTVDRTGQLLGLGEVEITEEMLRANRAEDSDAP